MSAIDRLIAVVMLALALLLAGWIGVLNYGLKRWQAGYDEAVADGKERRDLEAQVARDTEDALRAQLRAKDEFAHRREQEHAESLEAAQRRVRAGVDRLRCPAAGPVPAVATAEDRSAAAGPAADGPGPELVPEAASDVLGYGAAIAGLVRRYERVLERAEACREVSAK